ncbi:transporter substrate-binding domain-containing protein [Exiguobacterium sp. SL14]|nr:transporter substrate-binding domain-containing protein [Exiguobacterium sp. SL14]MCY1690842.1 transporter substrate-binding domain-containing protein [Exiguobacterium sp. SL14]
MKKGSILLALLMSCILVLGACSIGSKEEESSEGKTYKVGIDVTYPPFEYKDGDTYKGIDIDLMKAIAKDQNFKIQFEAMDFSGIIPLQANQLDVAIAGMSITPERKKVVTFSDPYFKAGLILVVKEDENGIKSVNDLKGKKVAVKKGTTGAKYATDNADKLGFTVTQFNDSPAMFQEVKNGNAKLTLIEDYPVISYANKQQNLGLKLVGDRLNGDNYGIAVLKGENEDLMKKINKGLANLKENGEYDKIVDTYLK